MQIDFYRKQFAEFEYYPPCTNSKVRKIMQQHDALVLPSIAEGRALVQQEFLSCGLPIIVTPNAGGEDLIDEGTTGYLVPIRSPEKDRPSHSCLSKIRIVGGDSEVLQKKAMEYSVGKLCSKHY